MANDDVTDVLLRTLDKMGAEIDRAGALSRLNAILSLADPRLVLPSPAVGLLSLETRQAQRCAPGALFRSSEPLGSAGEALFSPIQTDTIVLPWRVVKAEWIRPTAPGCSEAEASDVLVSGLALELERTGSQAHADAPLRLLVDGDDLVQWGLDSARATLEGDPVEVARPRPPSGLFSGLIRHAGPVHYAIDALFGRLLDVPLSGNLSKHPRLRLDLHFGESIPVDRQAKPPDVWTNVVPVWNSVESTYPALNEIQQAVSEASQRISHPLRTHHLGPHWKVFDLLRAGPSNDGSWNLARRDSDRTDVLSERSVLLSYAPGAHEENWTAWTRGGEPSVDLHVVLTPEARKKLDRLGARLAVRYRSTTGARANGLPSEAEFRLVSPFGLPPGEEIFGCLVGTTWAGYDGISLDFMAEAGAEALRALLPVGFTRTVEDLTVLFRTRFGDTLALVDEFDLLRYERDDGRARLDVRVRFLDAARPWRERRAILAACQAYLNRYLAAQPWAHVSLVEVAEEVRR
jgi:hypothetical protein